jgi:hypothetical protein
MQATWGEAFGHVLRDVGDLPAAALVALAALPVAALLLIIAGSRLAFIPLASWVGVVATWFFYYLSGQSNLGVGGLVSPALVIAASWVLLVVDALRLPLIRAGRRRGRQVPSPG